MLQAVVFGHGDGEAEAAGLEGAGRVRSLFLDVKARVALAVEHRRPAFAEGDGGYVGQDAGVAPHADQAYAAAGGVEDSVRILPAELLDELVAHGLFAFNAERLFEA